VVGNAVVDDDGWEDVRAPDDVDGESESTPVTSTPPLAVAQASSSPTPTLPSPGPPPPPALPDEAPVPAAAPPPPGESVLPRALDPLAGAPTIIEPARSSDDDDHHNGDDDDNQRGALSSSDPATEAGAVPSSSLAADAAPPAAEGEPELPPELAAPSTGFDDGDTDSAPAKPGTTGGRGRQPPEGAEGAASEASESSEASDSSESSESSEAFAAFEASAATVVESHPASVATTDGPRGSLAGDRGGFDDLHARKTVINHDVDLDPLPEIDRFGVSRNTLGAGVALFFAGMLVVAWLAAHVPGRPVAGAPSPPAVVVDDVDHNGDAGAAPRGNDARGGIDAGAPTFDGGAVRVDGGVAAALVDAGVGPALFSADAVDGGSTPDAAPPAAGAATPPTAVTSAGLVVDGGSLASNDGPVDAGADDLPDDEQREYDRQLKRAEQFVRRGDYGRSVQAYRAALARRGDSVTAHLGLGEAYYELDNLTMALTHLERARVLAPRDPQVYVLLGAAYQSSNRKPDAIAAYERFLALAPDGKMAHDVRAILRGLKN
jgi:hypothetical protein